MQFSNLPPAQRSDAWRPACLELAVCGPKPVRLLAFELVLPRPQVRDAKLHRQHGPVPHGEPSSCSCPCLCCVAPCLAAQLAAKCGCCPNKLVSTQSTHFPTGHPQCISATRLGCDTAADCCNSLPCERTRSTASMGTCQRVWSGRSALPGPACLHVTAQPSVARRTLLAASHAWVQCISVARHGCSQNADCCKSSLCQKDAAASPLGSCRTVSLPATRGLWRR